MKKYLIIAGLVCVASIPPATAVTKCVALNQSNTKCGQQVPALNVADWTTPCTTNETEIQISGIGICSATAGTASQMGKTATSLNMASTAADNKYCWCRMISPVVSRWVFRWPMQSADDCSENCAGYCVWNGMQNRSYLSGMFGNLSD